jgi:DNA polymerase-3 subunit delta'
MFVLVAHQPQKILPTIMSRCQKVEMPVPSKDDAIAWMHNQGISNAEAVLNYAGGSPIQAIDEAEEGVIASMAICKHLLAGAKTDVFQTAGACLELGMENAINTLQKWCYDLMLSKTTKSTRYHLEQNAGIQTLSTKANLAALLDFLRKLDEAKKSATHPLNNDLQLTRLLHNYTQIFTS